MPFLFLIWRRFTKRCNLFEQKWVFKQQLCFTVEMVEIFLKEVKSSGLSWSRQGSSQLADGWVSVSGMHGGRWRLAELFANLVAPAMSYQLTLFGIGSVAPVDTFYNRLTNEYIYMSTFSISTDRTSQLGQNKSALKIEPEGGIAWKSFPKGTNLHQCNHLGATLLRLMVIRYLWLWDYKPKLFKVTQRHSKTYQSRRKWIE